MDSTVFDPHAPSPYCKGCGHGVVSRALGAALERVARPAHDVAIVTDIGCVGLADQLFATPHTVHTTHGRSTAVGVGLAMASRVMSERRLTPIVLIGDGGAMIGLNHLVHGALVNADVTVVVHNNFLFGMTGGQNSVFSPEDFVTATTPHGSGVRPLDLARVLTGSHASFVARVIAGDASLAAVLQEAIETPGFAVVEVLELCTGFATKWNPLTGKLLRDVAARAGYELGVLQRIERPPFAVRPPQRSATGKSSRTTEGARPLAAVTAPLDCELRVVIAGTAGERVQTAAVLLAGAALDSALHVTLKNDYPVTQGTGFSVSELVIGPTPIGFTGIEHADAVLVVSGEGASELARNGTLDRLEPGARVLMDSSMTVPDVPCPIVRLPFRASAGNALAALAAVAHWVSVTGAVPVEAFRQRVEGKLGDDVARKVFMLVGGWQAS